MLLVGMEVQHLRKQELNPGSRNITRSRAHEHIHSDKKNSQTCGFCQSVFDSVCSCGALVKVFLTVVTASTTSLAALAAVGALEDIATFPSDTVKLETLNISGFFKNHRTRCGVHARNRNVFKSGAFPGYNHLTILSAESAQLTPSEISCTSQYRGMKGQHPARISIQNYMLAPRRSGTSS